MSVARAFGKLWPHRLAQFDWSALVILSRGKVPRSARAEALLCARAGENIGKSLAEAIVARHLGLALPDPVAERLVNRMFQTLCDFEKYCDRVTAVQRERVTQRLVALANFLNHSPPKIEEPDLDGEELPDEEVLPPASMSSEAHPNRAATVRERFTSELPTASTAPSRSRLNVQGATQPSTDSASVGPRRAAPGATVARQNIAVPSRSTFLAGIMLALGGFFGRRSFAAAELPVAPSSSFPEVQREPGGESQILLRGDTPLGEPPVLESIVTRTDSSGRIVQTTYSYTPSPCHSQAVSK